MSRNVADTPHLPEFTTWSTFPFHGDLRIKPLDGPVESEPERKGLDPAECHPCNALDDEYIWVDERWRVRSTKEPTGVPVTLLLEPRVHLDLGDLPNLYAAELGVLTVRLERAIRSIGGVGRVHVYRWGDGSAHMHLWFTARPYGQLQLRGTFLPLWEEILPPVDQTEWRENLAMIAAVLADSGGKAILLPAPIEWQAPDRFE